MHVKDRDRLAALTRTVSHVLDQDLHAVVADAYRRSMRTCTTLDLMQGQLAMGAASLLRRCPDQRKRLWGCLYTSLPSPLRKVAWLPTHGDADEDTRRQYLEYTRRAEERSESLQTTDMMRRCEVVAAEVLPGIRARDVAC